MENPSSLPMPDEASEPPTPVPNDLTGRTLSDFQLVRRIGQGGMGQVYLARQLSLKRQVAVKILRTDLAANTTALQRFKLEAEAVAQITHANIVQVYAIGESDGFNYMALEYVEGRNLRDFIKKKGPPALPIAINIMRQVAAALQRASELGFVHRDIKPENILLNRKGEVKVADFGLSRCFASEQQLNITQSGLTMGTPLYMSPEQVQGHTVDPRSDIYSFGVSCYHMLAGEPPFQGQTPFEVALQHVQQEPSPLNQIRPDLPPDLCAIVHRMIEKRPEDRYQTALEILRDLARLKEILATPQGLQTSIAGQPLLANSGRNSAVTTPFSGETAVVPGAPNRWRRWLVVGVSLLGAGAAGAAIHWRSVPPEPPTSIGTNGAGVEKMPNPSIALERDLLKRLNERGIKSDLEVTNSVLELGLLYMREKRTSEATHLFELNNLRSYPALMEAQKTFQFPQLYLPLVSHLGKGVMLSLADLPEDSNSEIKSALNLGSKAKVILKQMPIDVFLWKYERWKKSVADALERNAKNQNVTNLVDQQLNRYRHYSKAP
jgi:serine/threonine-protein kinase